MQTFLQINMDTYGINLAELKIKVGDIVKNEVLRTKIPKTQIARDLKKSRTWLDGILNSEEIEMKHIIAIGKAIRYDFSKHFPQLISAKIDKLVTSPDTPFSAMDDSELRNQLIEMQGKYIKLLEEHVDLLRKVKDD